MTTFDAASEAVCVVLTRWLDGDAVDVWRTGSTISRIEVAQLAADQISFRDRSLRGEARRFFSAALRVALAMERPDEQAA